LVCMAFGRQRRTLGWTGRGARGPARTCPLAWDKQSLLRLYLSSQGIPPHILLGAAQRSPSLSPIILTFSCVLILIAMTTITASRPPPLLLRPASITTDSRRLSADTVSTRTTCLTVASTISRPNTPPTPYDDCFDGPRSPTLPSQANHKKAEKKKKSSNLLGFLSVREPSSRALEQYEQEQLRRATAVARERGRPVTTAALGVSRTKMPASVPKVNSKWDGLPPAMSAQGPDRSFKGGDGSDGSSTHSISGGRQAFGPPGSSGGMSCDGSDFMLQLTQGHNRHNRRPARRSFLSGPEFEGPGTQRYMRQSHISSSATSFSSVPSVSSRLTTSDGPTRPPTSVSNTPLDPVPTRPPTGAAPRSAKGVQHVSPRSTWHQLHSAPSSQVFRPAVAADGNDAQPGSTGHLDHEAPAVPRCPSTQGDVQLLVVPKEAPTRPFLSPPTSLARPATANDACSRVRDTSDFRSRPPPLPSSFPESGGSPRESNASRSGIRSIWRRLRTSSLSKGTPRNASD
ncbi:MAG: hypothetical protein M1823_004524, partial [Watsoniomyces obsoletus]